MSSDQENLRRLAEVKSYIEEKISQLEKEIAMLRTISEIIDRELLSKSFKKAYEQAPKSEETTLRRLRGRGGQLLATMAMKESEIRIILNPEIKVRRDDRPFSSFLIRKVLEQYVENDLQLVDEGKLEPDKVLTYEVIYDNDLVREIIVKNYGGEERLREIINAVRWMLETLSASK